MENNGPEVEARRELAFERVYRELTGASEARARAVFMYAGCRALRPDENLPEHVTVGLVNRPLQMLEAA